MAGSRDADSLLRGGGREPRTRDCCQHGALCHGLHAAAQRGSGLGDVPFLLPCVFPCISSQLSPALSSQTRVVLPLLLCSPLNTLCRSVDVIPDNPKFQQLQRELSQVLTQRQIHIQPDN